MARLEDFWRTRGASFSREIFGRLPMLCFDIVAVIIGLNKGGIMLSLNEKTEVKRRKEQLRWELLERFGGTPGYN